MENKSGFRLSGEKRKEFMLGLNNHLTTLSKKLVDEDNSYQRKMLSEFGTANAWDFTILPQYDNTYRIIGNLVDVVRQHYQWFGLFENPKNPEENRDYFDEINLSEDSGLPWVFNFVELSRLQNNAPELLSKMPSYKDSLQRLQVALLEDSFNDQETVGKSNSAHRNALKRNYLEKLQTYPLIDWRGDDTGFFVANKLLPLGGETLWNFYGVKYLKTSSMFEIYIVDMWQDIMDSNPHIKEVTNTGEVSISPQLEKSFLFGKDNAPWYVLRSIDERFESLHPVHVSRALIGPFEHKNKSDKTLPIMNEILAEDENAATLRFSRQYSYAPNHKIVKGKIRQVVHQENWADEIIVSPSKFAGRIAKSVLGTNVRVFELEEGKHD